MTDHALARVRTRFVWLAIFAAAAHLPTHQVTPAWIAALTLPAVGLVLLDRHRVGPALARRLVVGAIQLGCVYLLQRTTRQLTQSAALACMLLPPTAYLAARRRPNDPAIALLLSFWLFLFGAVLRGTISAPFVTLYTCFAGIALNLDARFASRLQRNHHHVAGSPHGFGWLRRAWMPAIACLLATLGLLKLFAALPSPGAGEEKQAAENKSGRKRTGLPNSFDLTDRQGVTVELRNDRLLRARTTDGRPMPRQLYLRCSHFDIAGLDRWTTAPLRLRRRDARGTPWRIRRSVPEVMQRDITVEPIDAPKAMVFVAPGTTSLRGLLLRGDTDRAWFRAVNQTAPYRFAYQELRDHIAMFRGRLAAADLTRLPKSLRSRRFVDAATALLKGAPSHPAGIAAHLEYRVSRSFQYALETPRGPYEHAILNFLYGERRGYCMHFASTMAIVARTAGVPCRIAVGLYAGDPDPDDPSIRHFGSHHAHAWVEVPFPNLGWVAFDPTPPSGRGVDAPIPGLDLTDNAASTGGAERAAETSLAARIANGPLGQFWMWGALLAIWFWLFHRSGKGDASGRRASASVETRSPARRLLGAILMGLAKAGLPRGRGQTLESYHSELARNDDLDHAALGDAFAAYQEVRFGGREFDAPRRRRLETGVETATRLKNERNTPA